MSLSLPQLTPVLVTAAIAWAYYRRLRSHFGRQRYRPRRALFRLGVLGLAGVALALAAAFVPDAAWTVVPGAVAGAALGVFALGKTRVDAGDGAAHYTPNPWIGGALSLLLVGRLAWRWSQGGFAPGAPTQPTSALTLGIAAVLVAYYLAYGIGLRRRVRQAPPVATGTV